MYGLYVYIIQEYTLWDKILCLTTHGYGVLFLCPRKVFQLFGGFFVRREKLTTCAHCTYLVNDYNKRKN